MQEFFQLVANFGFPIVVAGYLLFRFEDKIENLGELITTLIQTYKDGTNKNNQVVKDLTRQVESLTKEVEKINTK